MITHSSMTKHVSKFLIISGLAVLILIAIALLPLFTAPAAQADTRRLPESRAEIELTFAPTFGASDAALGSNGQLVSGTLRL